MHKNKLVSVIIPTYNREKTLSRALASIQKQNHRPIEIIIVDDGSNDKTELLIGSYNFQDIYYILIKNKYNMGIGYSRNIWMKSAKWKYIALLDSDDEWTDENKISRQVNFLEKNLDYWFVGCGWSLKKINLYDTGGPLFKTDKEFRKMALEQYCVHTSTWVFPKYILDQVGYFWNKKCEDYDYLLKIWTKYKCYCLPEIMSKYNNWSHWDRTSNLFKSFIFSLYIAYRYRKKYPWFWKALIKRFNRVIKKILKMIIWTPGLWF